VQIEQFLHPIGWTDFRVVLEKLKVLQLIKKFPTFYGTRRFINVFTRARHWLLFRTRLIQSTPFQPISLKFIITLPSLLRLGLRSGFQTRILYTFMISPMHATWPISIILFDFITLIIFGLRFIATRHSVRDRNDEAIVFKRWISTGLQKTTQWEA